MSHLGTYVVARGYAIGNRPAMDAMQTAFRHAVRGRGFNPTAIFKCHRQRPSERLM